MATTFVGGGTTYGTGCTELPQTLLFFFVVMSLALAGCLIYFITGHGTGFLNYDSFWIACAVAGLAGLGLIVYAAFRVVCYLCETRRRRRTTYDESF